MNSGPAAGMKSKKRQDPVQLKFGAAAGEGLFPEFLLCVWLQGSWSSSVRAYGSY